MGEVEAQVIGRHQRAGLRDVRAEHLAERGVEQMRPGVVLAQALAARRLHADRHVFALAEAPAAHAHAVDEKLRAAVVRVDDLATAVAPDERTDVAHLTARLGVSRGAIEDHLDLGALRHFGHTPQPIRAIDEGQDPCRRRERLVADELHRRDVGGEPMIEARPVAAFLGRKRRAGPGPLTLGVHLALPRDLGRVGHAPAGVLEDFLGEVAREAVRVVEREQELPVDGPSLPLPPLRGEELLDLLHADVERLREALFLLADDLLDASALGHQLRIGRLHHGGDPIDRLVEERLVESEPAAVAHGPAHDPAQDVAPPLVGRCHAVADQERRRPRVVGDDAHGDVVRGIGAAVRLARQRGDAIDQRAQQVGVVVRELALHDRGDALEPHAGVDRRPRQGRPGSGRVAVELHEHEIPDLEPAVTLASRAETLPAGRLFRARQVIALMEVDLRARTAGAVIAHGPEVVLLAEAQDPVVPEAGDLLPERKGVVVVGEDGRDQPLAVEAEIPGQEFPAIPDGVGLEVVPEREVAEHLEERVMARGPADVLEVIVLAAGAHALLSRRGAPVVALLLAREDALELHHAGVGEEQRGIIVRHERRRAHTPVAVALEVAEKLFTQAIAGHRGSL